MAVDLSEDVKNQLESQYGIITLVKFEIPDFVRGFYRGPRALTYNGFTYQPNDILDIDDLAETLDTSDEERQITLTGISDETGDAPRAMASKKYIGAPAFVTRLIVDIKTNEIKGIGESSVYEIYDLEIVEQQEDDLIHVSLVVSLRAVGFTGRRKTPAIRSQIVHRENFNPNSTFYEEADRAAAVQRRWGQRSG